MPSSTSPSRATPAGDGRCRRPLPLSRPVLRRAGPPRGGRGAAGKQGLPPLPHPFRPGGEGGGGPGAGEGPGFLPRGHRGALEPHPRHAAVARAPEDLLAAVQPRRDGGPRALLPGTGAAPVRGGGPAGRLAGLLLLALLGWASPAAAQRVAESCATCHLEIGDERLAAPVKAFAEDIHAANGVGCA